MSKEEKPELIGAAEYINTQCPISISSAEKLLKNLSFDEDVFGSKGYIVNLIIDLANEGYSAGTIYSRIKANSPSAVSAPGNKDEIIRKDTKLIAKYISTICRLSYYDSEDLVVDLRVPQEVYGKKDIIISLIAKLANEGFDKYYISKVVKNGQGYIPQSTIKMEPLKAWYAGSAQPIELVSDYNEKPLILTSTLPFDQQKLADEPVNMPSKDSNIEIKLNGITNYFEKEFSLFTQLQKDIADIGTLWPNPAKAILRPNFIPADEWDSLSIKTRKAILEKLNLSENKKKYEEAIKAKPDTDVVNYKDIDRAIDL